MSSLGDQNPLDLSDAGLEVLGGHLHLGPGGLNSLLNGRDVRIHLTTCPDNTQGLDLEIHHFNHFVWMNGPDPGESYGGRNELLYKITDLLFMWIREGDSHKGSDLSTPQLSLPVLTGPLEENFAHTHKSSTLFQGQKWFLPPSYSP